MQELVVESIKYLYTNFFEMPFSQIISLASTVFSLLAPENTPIKEHETTVYDGGSVPRRQVYAAPLLISNKR